MTTPTGGGRGRLAIAVAFVCLFLCGGARLAQNVYTLHIEAQPLDRALQDFARQTGIQILFFSELTDGHRSVALSGRYTFDAALAELLSGSQLTYRRVNAKTIEIVSAGALRPGRKTEGRLR
jgi:hypothetical protein